MDRTADIGGQERMSAMGCAVVIPTYNNSSTLRGVVEGVSCHARDIIVVDDGSTDGTRQLLAAMEGITVLTHERNKGKGEALKTGLRHAASLGFDYAVTIDSDGQHFPEDILRLLDAVEGEPGALVIGYRNLQVENRTQITTCANRFSNFWVRLE
ncbi:MAG: glycosyltransferase family 2 protein, partial [Alistipes sp.]|nr:glycosyltransferase family 2 protein [Alistipes sp.]